MQSIRSDTSIDQEMNFESGLDEIPRQPGIENDGFGKLTEIFKSAVHQTIDFGVFLGQKIGFEDGELFGLCNRPVHVTTGYESTVVSLSKLARNRTFSAAKLTADGDVLVDHPRPS
jgi:hypothetical protein